MVVLALSGYYGWQGQPGALLSTQYQGGIQPKISMQKPSARQKVESPYRFILHEQRRLSTRPQA